MKNARILVLEDDKLWRDTIQNVFESLADHIALASSLAEALDLADKRYFNVAVVDWSLCPGDAGDAQGIEFLRQLRARGVDETIRCVILSSYGTVRRVRDAFRDFDVTDFVDKREFTEQNLVAAVQQALALNHLDHDLQVQLASEGDIDQLWERFAWAKREDPFQLRPEMRDLLRRLFPGADSLFIRDLPAGQSGAGVLQVEPCYAAGSGTPAVVKFGKKGTIRQERDNFAAHVAQFVGTYSSTQPQ